MSTKTFYCEKCMRLTEGCCPICGKGNLPLVQADDFVYLTEIQYIWLPQFIELLDDNNITHYEKPLYGAGLSSQLGISTEVYELFIPYSQYTTAKTIINDFFNENV